MSIGLNDSAKCQWCGNFHQFKCPLVKSFEYENGIVKKVEFFAPNDYAPAMAVKPGVSFPTTGACGAATGDSR